MNHCAVCGLECAGNLCPGCTMCWMVGDAPCSLEGFEAWKVRAREDIDLAREGVFR